MPLIINLGAAWADGGYDLAGDDEEECDPAAADDEGDSREEGTVRGADEPPAPDVAD